MTNRRQEAPLSSLRRCATLLTLWLLAYGVSWASPDIAIINLSSEKTAYPTYSSWRQFVAQVDGKSGSFTTLVKAERLPASFILKVYDFEGKLLKETPIPEFVNGPGSTWEWALSADGSKIVYRDREDIKLLDVASQTTSMVWKGAMSKYGPDFVVRWLSDYELVLCIDIYNDSSRNEISIFNIANMRRKVLYHPSDMHHDAQLSPDKRLLAFAESPHGHVVNKVITILDLEKGEVVATVGNGDQLIGTLMWSLDGDELAFVEGQEVKVWRREDQQVRRLTEAKKDTFAGVAFFAKGRIGYMVRDPNRNYSGFFGLFGGGKDLFVIDSSTGKRLQTLSEQFNGWTFYVEETNSLIAEIGY
jgi:Tol biopolymer transport system component